MGIGSLVRRGAYSGLATKAIPPGLAALVDLRRPSCWTSWGGPLNGQARRRDLVRDLARAISFDRVVETGTFRGTSTEFFAAVFGVPVLTVENSRRFFSFSSRRLAALSDVTVSHGDSVEFLERLASTGGDDGTVFFYLDAHWRENQPLPQELRVIAAHWNRCVVMVDDFEVPGDAGYGYANFGPTSVLTERVLPTEVLGGWGLFYPSTGSADDTGSRRGCCVLASPPLVGAARVPTLGPARII